jgi:hypothetical protein
MIDLVNERRNMIIRLFIFITLLLIVSANDGLCEIYKWRSDDGSISFTDDLDKIPEKYREQAEVMKFKSNESDPSEKGTITEDDNIPTDKDIGKDRAEPQEEEKTTTDENIGGVDE